GAGRAYNAPSPGYRARSTRIRPGAEWSRAWFELADAREVTMYDREAIERIRRMRQAWESEELRQFVDRQPESRAAHRRASRLPRQRVYTPEAVADTPYEAIGLPGQYPFTRGPYPTMYRGRLWTMRQIAGYGTGADTNARFRYLIAQGQTGLSVDFD